MKINTDKIKLFIKKYIKGFFFIIFHIEIGQKKQALSHLKKEEEEIKDLENKIQNEKK